MSLECRWMRTHESSCIATQTTINANVVRALRILMASRDTVVDSLITIYLVLRRTSLMPIRFFMTVNVCWVLLCSRTLCVRSTAPRASRGRNTIVYAAT